MPSSFPYEFFGVTAFAIPAAIAALMMSAAIKGSTAMVSSSQIPTDAPVHRYSCMRPGMYISVNVENSMIANIGKNFLDCMYLSTMYPMNMDAITNPIRYPPVGPARYARPLFNPANHGTPAAPIPRYITWLTPPQVPSITPASRTPKTCPVTGTRVPGR